MAIEIIERTTWGSLICESSTTQERVIKDGGVTETFSDTKLVCRCNCGNLIEFWQSELPKSKWALPQDCGCGIFHKQQNAARRGQALVGIGVKPRGRGQTGRPRGRTTTAVTVSLEDRLIAALNEYCEQQDCTFSKAVNTMLWLGISYLESQDEEKHKQLSGGGI